MPNRIEISVNSFTFKPNNETSALLKPINFMLDCPF